MSNCSCRPTAHARRKAQQAHAQHTPWKMLTGLSGVLLWRGLRRRSLASMTMSALTALVAAQLKGYPDPERCSICGCGPACICRNDSDGCNCDPTCGCHTPDEKRPDDARPSPKADTASE